MVERRDDRITDLDRRVSSAVLIGTVSQVDHEKARYRVKSGDLETDWIPFTSARAGKTRTYDSLDEGEQVVVVCPSGDTAQGVIVGSVATEAAQAADKGNLHRTVYPDGTVVEYDHEAKAYRMAVAEGGSFALAIGGGGSVSGAGNKITIKAADILLDGDVEVTGNMSSGGGLDVRGSYLRHNGVNVGQDHRHTGVLTGGGSTGEPQQ